MPYKVAKSSDCPEDRPYAVVKIADGSVVGCHATPEAAGAQIGIIQESEAKK